MKKYLLLSHPFDRTGAPQVLRDIIADLLSSGVDARSITLLSTRIEGTRRAELEGMGIQAHAESSHDRLLALLPSDLSNTRILINSRFVPTPLRASVMESAHRKECPTVIWFIHEDPQLLRSKGEPTFDAREVRQAEQGAREGSLLITVPAAHLVDEYSQQLAGAPVHRTRLITHMPDRLTGARPAVDFDTLRLFMSGTIADGRKGHFLVITALLEAIRQVRADPRRYRDISLHVIGDDPTHFTVQQLVAIGNQLPEGSFTYARGTSRENAIEIGGECNVTISASASEAFPLVVTEGMAMGHVLLRSDSGGHLEQLSSGKNGLGFGRYDILSMTAAMLALADRELYPNAKLAAMSQASFELSLPYLQGSYLSQFRAATGNSNW